MWIQGRTIVFALGCAAVACGAHDAKGTAGDHPSHPVVTSVEAPESIELSQEEQAVFALLNQERKSRNLFPLKISYELSGVARKHSLEMAGLGDAYHDSPKTGGVKDRVQSIDYKFTFLAENVGAGGDPASLHDAWMHSRGHRENLLHPDARQVGIGLASGKLSGVRVLFGTQVFASQAPKLNTRKVAADLLALANATRKSQGATPLTTHKGLVEAAVQNQSVCFHGGQINLLGTDWHQGKVGAKLFTLASTEHITQDDIQPMLDPSFSMVGLHVAQETDPHTGANMLCVILILGAAN